MVIVVLIEFMSEPEQPFKPLPVDDDVMFKLIDDLQIGVHNHEETLVFNPRINRFGSTKHFLDNLARHFITKLYPAQIFEEGIKARVLEPEKKWVTGTIRLRLVVEFVPDEPEEKAQ